MEWRKKCKARIKWKMEWKKKWSTRKKCKTRFKEVGVKEVKVGVKGVKEVGIDKRLWKT